MSVSNIILIAVVLVIVFVLVWCLKTGNNIKIFNKKDKKKSKPSAEEKYKDVIPKEKKKENNKKQHKPEIKKSAKSELKKEKQGEPATITKITKEDFKNNDLKVPDALLTGEEKDQKETFKPLSSGKEDIPNFDFNKDLKFDKDLKFNDDFKFGELNDDFKFDEDLMLGNPFSKPATPNSFKTKSEFSGGFNDTFLPPLDSKSQFSESMLDNIEKDNFLNESPFKNEQRLSIPKDKALDNKPIEERIGMVFSGTEEAQKELSREVIIGEILSEPRARANRRARERRNM